MQKLSLFYKAKMVLWPIERKELSIFLPMALIMFCLLFNFSALRSVKDSLVVPSIGAEVISFLKLWLVLPSALTFTLLYIKLSNIYRVEKVFYITVSFFLISFLFFGFIIYPNQDFLHPSDEFIQELMISFPYLQWFIKIIGKWSLAVMYIFSELWSVVVINLIYWQFANGIFYTKDAKRFYPILGMVGNLGLIVSGNFLISSCDPLEIFEPLIYMFDARCTTSEVTLKLIILAIVFSGIISMVVFRYLNTVVLKSSNHDNINDFKVNYNTKTKLSLKESIFLVLNSKYIRHIAIMVICYGLSINILEGPWKARVRELYPTTQDYIKFMGKFNIVMGISCIVFMIIGSNILRIFSWLFSALITPLIIGITGVLFFLLVMAGDSVNSLNLQLYNPLYLAVLIGALQNILSKSSKYSLFDTTKEMAYIPLKVELRTKGKAAVEILGMKLGKSGGAFIQSMIFTFVPNATFDNMSIILISVFVIIISIWIADVYKLYYQYSAINRD